MIAEITSSANKGLNLLSLKNSVTFCECSNEFQSGLLYNLSIIFWNLNLISEGILTEDIFTASRVLGRPSVNQGDTISLLIFSELNSIFFLLAPPAKTVILFNFPITKICLSFNSNLLPITLIIISLPISNSLNVSDSK